MKKTKRKSTSAQRRKQSASMKAVWAKRKAERKFKGISISAEKGKPLNLRGVDECLVDELERVEGFSYGFELSHSYEPHKKPTPIQRASMLVAGILRLDNAYDEAKHLLNRSKSKLKQIPLPKKGKVTLRVIITPE